MNKEQTKEAIAVMQSFVDGKRIEYSADKGKTYDTWPGYDAPVWDWYSMDYRIKPEIVYYRRSLHLDTKNGKYYVLVAGREPIIQEYQGWMHFVRWIDNEWQEEIV